MFCVQGVAAIALLAGCAAAQQADTAGPPAPVAPDVHDVLKMLQDRKGTLKDFTSQIKYSTTDKLGDTTSKTGTLDFLMDPTLGPEFSADFAKQIDVNGRAHDYHVQFIFDGHDFTAKDFGAKNNVMQFVRQPMVKPGEAPGSATTLSGPMPLPIGLDAEDVARNFAVTLEPSNDANVAVLKLVPREKGKFEYASLEVTVDKSKQVPVKLVETAADGTTTGMELTELKINPGNAHMLDASTPASAGWTERK